MSEGQSEWSNDLIFDFIALYEKYEVLWDPKHLNHKNRNKINDAWNEIREQLAGNFTIDHLKKKKESLMTTYRSLKKKVKESEKSGAGTSDIYKPTWFAYDAMDRFLRSTGKINKTLNTEVDEENSNDNRKTNIELVNETEYEGNELSGVTASSTNVHNQTAQTIENMVNTEPKKLFRSPNKKRRAESGMEIYTQMKRACDALDVIKQRSPRQHQTPDECTLYGQLLASRLRSLKNARTRKILIHKIDNLVFEAELREMDVQNEIIQPQTRGSLINLYNFDHSSPIPSPSAYSRSNENMEETRHYSELDTEPDSDVEQFLSTTSTILNL